MKAITLELASGIVLVPLSPSHADALASLVAQNFLFLQTFLPTVTELNTPERASAHIQAMQKLAAKGELFEWHLFVDDTLCGNIRLKDIDANDRKAKIGYFIGRDFQGRGIATSAVHAVLAYCFNSLDINRVELRCTATNLPSIRVAERLCFKREGILRQEEYLHGAFVDTIVYSLLNSEFNNRTL